MATGQEPDEICRVPQQPCHRIDSLGNPASCRASGKSSRRRWCALTVLDATHFQEPPKATVDIAPW